jgi:tetratricopeptide (TPR) repeat protein
MSAALKLKTQTEIKLVIQKGPHAGQRFSFSKKEITIGRAPENDIVLLNDPLISRQHAKVAIVGADVEVINLSQKNSIMVGTESVQKWKLVNEGTFKIGDTEFQIYFHLGQSVTPIQAPKPVVHLQSVQAPAANRNEIAKKTATTAALTAQPQNIAIKSNQQVPQQKNQQQIQMQHRMQQQQYQIHMQAQAASAQQKTNANTLANTQKSNSGFLANPKTRFYLIIAVGVAIAAYFYFDTPSVVHRKAEDKKTILKYSDEVEIKLNSKIEKENQKKIEKLYEQKNSPTTLRAEENFIKGMRDFQLGNYTRAQEFFQVVLNLQPGHELARRHLYLSKVRYDEVLKAKLMLGESYYQKHNFRMCQSLYEQVLNMLQGKSSDQNYQLATAMAEKCKLASEGVR